MMDERHFAELLHGARRIVSNSEGDERLLAYLRENGATKIDSIKIIQNAKSLSLKDADELVHYSSVWADRRESDESALDTFLDDVDDEIDFDDLASDK